MLRGALVWQWIIARALLGQAPAGAQKALVRFGYFSESMPLGVACARRWLDTEDFEVGCFPQSSGGYAVSRLDQGDLDVTMLGSTPAAICNSRGVQATTFQMAHGHSASQGLAVRGIRGPLEILGLCLASPFGSTAHYHLLFFLRTLELPICAGSMTCDEVSPSCVTIVNMSPSALMEAWDLEQIDGAFIFGAGFLHLQATGGTVVIDSDVLKRWGKETFVLIAARQNFSEDFPGLLEHISRVKLTLDDGWLLPDPAWDNRESGNESFLASMSHFLSMTRPREVEASKAVVIHDDMRSKQFFSTRTQLGCKYLAHTSQCPRSDTHLVSGLSEAIRATSMFFMEQKGLATVVPTGMHYDEDPASYFDGMIDASVLFTATGVHPVTLDTLTANTGGIVIPPSSSFETGTCDFGGVVLSLTGDSVVGSFTDKPGISADTLGASYENDMHCMFRIPPAQGNTSLVELTFPAFRVWSGDVVRVYEGDVANSVPTGKLLAQLQGIDPVIPPIRSAGPIIIEFVTDTNTEECYNMPEGDGWTVNFDRSHPGCTNDENCIHGDCVQESILDQLRNVCVCWPGWAGADCSFSGCLGTVTARAPTGTFRSGAASLQRIHRYENSAACIFEVYTEEQTISFAIEMDLENTFDWLEVRAGTGTSAIVHARLTGYRSLTVRVPAIDGVASLHYTTDDKGRRGGFIADYTTNSLPCQSQCSSSHGTCEGSTCVCASGWAGIDCTLPFCAPGSLQYIGKASGVIQSNPDTTSIPAMTDCHFETEKLSVPAERYRGKHVGTRLTVQTFDLEPAPSGDMVTVSYAGTDFSLRVERCTNSADCSHFWQSGECVDQVCRVRTSIDVLTTSRLQVHIQTDRNDITAPNCQGVAMTWHAIAACPTSGRTDWECIGPLGSCDCEVSDGICSADGACECPTGHCACGCGGHVTQPPFSNVSVALLLADRIQREAAELAIAHINADRFLPRINLQPVVVDVAPIRAANTRADAALINKTLIEIEQLFEDNEIHVAAGPSYSSTSFAMAPVMDNAFFVSHSATHPALSNVSTFPTFGRVVMSDDKQASAMADVLNYGQRVFDWRKVGIISCNDVYCRGLVEKTIDRLEESGITNIDDLGIIHLGETLESDVRRISNEIVGWLEDCVGITEKATAVILLLTHSQEGEMVLELASENQLPVSFLASEAIGSTALSTAAAQSAVLALRPGGVDPTHSLFEFVATRLPAAAVQPFALRAFDAVYVIAHTLKAVLQKGGNISLVADLVQTAQTVIFQGASGSIKFDENLDVIGMYELVSFYNTTTTTAVGSWNSDGGSIRLNLGEADHDKLVRPPVCGTESAPQELVVGLIVVSIVASGVLLLLSCFGMKQRWDYFWYWKRPYVQLQSGSERKRYRYRFAERDLVAALKQATNDPLTISVEAVDITAKRSWKPLGIRDEEYVTVTFMRSEHYRKYIETAIKRLHGKSTNARRRVAHVFAHGTLSKPDLLPPQAEHGSTTSNRFKRRRLKSTTSASSDLPDRWRDLILAFTSISFSEPMLARVLNHATALDSDVQSKTDDWEFAAVVTRRHRDALHNYLPDIAGRDEHLVTSMLRQIAELQIEFDNQGLEYTAMDFRHFDVDNEAEEKHLELIRWDVLMPIDAKLNGTGRLPPTLARELAPLDSAQRQRTRLEIGHHGLIWAFGLLVYQASTIGGLKPFFVDSKEDLIDENDLYALAYQWDQAKLATKIAAVVWPDATDLILGCLHSDSMRSYQSLKDVLRHPFLEARSRTQDSAGRLESMGLDMNVGSAAKLEYYNRLHCREYYRYHLPQNQEKFPRTGGGSSGWVNFVKQQATQLHCAIARKHAEQVEQMFRGGAVHVSMIDENVEGSTAQALHRAAFAGHIETMQILLRAIGCSASLKNDEKPSREVLRMLDCRTTLEYTPLMIARACGHEKVAALLTRCGCSVDLKSELGHTAQDLYDLYKQEAKNQSLHPWRHGHQLWLSTNGLEQYLSDVKKMANDDNYDTGIRIWNSKLMVANFDPGQMKTLLDEVRGRLPKSQDLALHFTKLRVARHVCLGSPGIRSSNEGQLGGGVSISLELLDELKWAKGSNSCDDDANFEFAMKVGGRLWGTKWFELMPGSPPADLAERLIELPRYGFQPHRLSEEELAAARASSHGKPVWGSKKAKLETALLVRVPSAATRDSKRILPGRPSVYIVPHVNCEMWPIDSEYYYSTNRIEALLVLQLPGGQNMSTLDNLTDTGEVHRVQVIHKQSDDTPNGLLTVLSADACVADSVQIKHSDPRPLISSYTAVLGRLYNTSSLLQRHQHSAAQRKKLWLENIARFTAAEMEGAIAGVEQEMPHSHAPGFFFTNMEVAQGLCNESGCGGIAPPVDGIKVFLKRPTYLDWQQNATDKFKANVATLMELDESEIQAMVVLQMPTTAVLKAALSDSSQPIFTIPPEWLTNKDTEWVYANAHIWKVYGLDSVSTRIKEDINGYEDPQDGHAWQLEPEREPESGQNFVHAVPVTIGALDDSTTSREIRGVINSRYNEGRLQYKVRWMGCGKSEDSWVDREAVTEGQIAKYERKRRRNELQTTSAASAASR